MNSSDKAASQPSARIARIQARETRSLPIRRYALDRDWRETGELTPLTAR